MFKHKTNFITLFFSCVISFGINNTNSNYPNFIFILADDQGWNGTSVEMIQGELNSKSDFYETPNIEKWLLKELFFQMLIQVLQYVLRQDIVYNLVKHQPD